eukprot:4181779-Pyramimonas_sp.AAC.1
MTQSSIVIHESLTCDKADKEPVDHKITVPVLWNQRAIKVGDALYRQERAQEPVPSKRGGGAASAKAPPSKRAKA